MKGDTSLCRVSQFWFNVRCATTSTSPFAMKCEMRQYYVGLQYVEKGDEHTRGASRIRSYALKF
jgi:hypothetical protein